MDFKRSRKNDPHEREYFTHLDNQGAAFKAANPIIGPVDDILDLMVGLVFKKVTLNKYVYSFIHGLIRPALIFNPKYKAVRHTLIRHFTHIATDLPTNDIYSMVCICRYTIFMGNDHIMFFNTKLQLCKLCIICKKRYIILTFKLRR